MRNIKNKKAQATLEVVLTFCVLAMFLFGITKIMFWFGSAMVHRADYYKQARAGMAPTPPQEIEFNYKPDKLSILRD